MRQRSSAFPTSLHCTTISQLWSGRSGVDPKAIADFNQLAAGDYYFETGRQLIQRQIDGRCVVVHRDAGRAGKTFDQLRRVDVALATRASGQIVFKIRVSEQGFKCSQRSAAKIGVQHHAGRVDHSPLRRSFKLRETSLHTTLN